MTGEVEAVVGGFSGRSLGNGGGIRLVPSRAGRWQKLGETLGSDHGRRTGHASRNSQVFVTGERWGAGLKGGSVLSPSPYSGEEGLLGTERERMEFEGLAFNQGPEARG